MTYSIILGASCELGARAGGVVAGCTRGGQMDSREESSADRGALVQRHLSCPPLIRFL